MHKKKKKSNQIWKSPGACALNDRVGYILIGVKSNIFQSSIERLFLYENSMYKHCGFGLR